MMKRITSQLKYVLVLFVLTLSVSCSTEDGMDGEQGPQGEQGPAGENGVDGNANVTSVVLEGFNLVTGVNPINVPELTADIFNNGFVEVYASIDPSAWLTLPIQVEVETGGENADGSPETAIVNGIELLAIENGRVILNSIVEGTIDLRFVLVQGTPSTTVVP